MKLSKFNHFIDVDGDHYIFNAYRRGLHKVESGVIEALHALEEGAPNWKHSLSEQYVKQLYDSGYIIAADTDEHRQILQERENILNDSSNLTLTIAPTLDCNFECPYCFQGSSRHYHSYMTEHTMNSTIKFIRSLITDRTKSITIIWYGGEPLLALPQIEQFTKLLRDNIVTPLNLSYSGKIITNGYSLTQKTALKLRSLDIMTAQVTIDGMPEHHNARRIRKGGSPTFEQIINNLMESCGIVRISVRINVDSENIGSFTSLIDYLNKDCGLKDRVDIVFEFTRDMGDTPWEKAFTSVERFVEHKIDLHKKLNSSGVHLYAYPKAVRLYCIVLKYWVIAPNGDLHKCLTTVNNPTQAVGNVNTMEWNDKALNHWLSYSPFNSNQCMSCNVLPLCMGGCVYNALNGKPTCSEWNFALHDFLKQWIKERTSEKIDDSYLDAIESC